MNKYDVAIIGGGIAGLSVAFFLAQVNKSVVLIDSAKLGKGTTYDAAGMLCPINELEFHETDLLQAGLAAQRIYDDLEKYLGDIGLIRNGTLEVALSNDDVSYLKRFFDFQINKGIYVKWLNKEELSDFEPLLSPQIPAAIFTASDIQVDNRLLTHRFSDYLIRNQVVILENAEVSEIIKKDSEFEIFIKDLQSISVENIVITTGSFELPDFTGTPEKVFPVKGQMISVEPPLNSNLFHTIRIRSKSYGNGYIVPKQGRWVIGSTSEEVGYDKRITLGGVLDILNRAYLTLPLTYDLSVLEMWSGLRPSTLSRRPYFGKIDEFYYLNGLYRHGILLGPFLGKALVELMLKKTVIPEAEPFLINNGTKN